MRPYTPINLEQILTAMRLCLTLCIGLLIIGSETQEKTPPDTILDYKHEKHMGTAVEQLDLAMSVLETSEQEELLEAAMSDLLDIISPGNPLRPSGSLRTEGETIASTESEYHARKFMKQVETLLEKFTEASRQYQLAFLTQARLRIVLGEIDEALQQYLLIKKNRWIDDRRPFFEDMLIERSGWETSIVSLYKLTVLDEYTDPSRRNFIDSFLSYLVRLESEKPGTKSMESIYPHLMESPKHPEYKSIAEALCRIADRQSETALKVLRTLDDTLRRKQEQTGKTVPEYRNIPLYQAAVVVRSDGSTDELWPYLQEFWDRNRDRPDYVIHFASTFYHWRTSMATSLKVTQFFEQACFFSNPEIMDKIPVDTLTHIMDLHLQPYYYELRDLDKAKAIALRLTEKYFPKTPGSVNAMEILGNIYREEGNTEKAKDTFIRIIKESPYDIWVERSENNLVQMWLNDQDPLDRVLMKIRSIFNLPNPTQQQRLQSLENRVKELYK